MSVTIHGSVLTTSVTIGVTPRNNVFTSAVLNAGDILVIVEAMNGAVSIPTGSTPTGGTGLSWTQIVDEQNTASHFSRVTAWWSAVPSDQTSTITCAITATGGNNVSGAAALYRLSGALASPAGQTGVFQGQTDPTGTSLQITGTLAGSLIVMGASDWSAGTAALTISISGTTSGTTDLNSLESGQFRGISASGAQSSSTNQGTLDYSAATGDWAAILFEIKAAPTGGVVAKSALPGRTWLRRFWHHQLLLPQPVVTAATQTVTPVGIDVDPAAVGEPTLTPGTATVSPVAAATSDAVGQSVLTTSYTLSPAAIGSSETVGNAALAQALAPTGVTSGEVVGQATLTTSYTLSPAGIPSSETLGQPTLTTSYTLSPSGIPSGEVVSQTALAQALAPPGIRSSEILGNPTLTPGAVTLSPAGIGTGELVGRSNVSLGAVQTVSPAGISTGETVGNPTLSPGTATLSPAGISSGELVGQSAVSLGAVQTISPAGIVSTGASGNPALTPGTATVSPASVDLTGVVGQATLTPGAVTLAPFGIPSAQLVGMAILAAQQNLSAIGIGSGQAFGNPTLTLGAPVTAIPPINAIGTAQPFNTATGTATPAGNANGTANPSTKTTGTSTASATVTGSTAPSITVR